MLFKYLSEPSLAQASYLIGCQATGDAIVVDPLRDIDRYVALAAAEGMRIAAVTETHIHADFCSGSRELALRTGARLYLSGEGGAEWRYGFRDSDRAIELHDGDQITLGKVRLTAMHTPGHTPEHLIFLVTDGAAHPKPMGMLTGDFLFVGDVGRPDLLETAAGQVGTMEASARALYGSLQRLTKFPDYLQVWPGHGAGSACGRALGSVPQTTLGYERLVNWALQPQAEAAFVAEVLRDQPDAPAYFAVMKRMNRDGPVIRTEPVTQPLRSGFEAEAWLEQRGLIIDARAADVFAAGHLRNTLNIPATPSFSTWFGSLVDYSSPCWLIAADEAQAQRLLRELMMIGYDLVQGVTAGADIEFGLASAQVAQRSAASLAGALGRAGLVLVDVRRRSEFALGAIPGAVNIPLAELPARLRELPADGTIVVQCATGGRSAIAASLLLLAGAGSVENLHGGFAAWTQGGFPVTRPVDVPRAS